jgi:sugar lactone lactonase YvrE
MIIFAMMPAALSFGAEAVKLRYVSSVYSDNKGDAFKAPQGAACAGNSLLVVADTGNGRLLKYNSQGGVFLFEGEYKIPELSRPSRLQINSKGDIFALDEKDQRIARLNAAGAFLAHVKPAGLPAPESFIPRSFAIDARDNIYVLDVFAERVLVLDPAGKFLREIKFPVNFGFFSDLTVDSGGTVFLLDSVQCMVYSAPPQAKVFTELTGKLKEYLLFPTNITLDSTGMMYITDQNGSAIVILNPAGSVMGKQLSMGWKEGWLRYPSQLCITEAGELFIADRENNRVQKFTLIRQ